jgi:hypothetical protein
MKKIYFLLFAICLITAACEKKAQCKIEKPANLKPIDWEGYNDVYTVYWNYYEDCSLGRNVDKFDTIDVYGWITGYSIHSYNLTLNDQYENSDKNISIQISSEIEEELYQTLCTTIWPKKCFIKGEIILALIQTCNCCYTKPSIIVHNVKDIYFE